MLKNNKSRIMIKKKKCELCSYPSGENWLRVSK